MNGARTDRFDYGKMIIIFIGAVWTSMTVFLHLGTEKAEKGRKEYAASADDLEGLAMQGISLQDIAKERVRRG